MQQPPMPQQWYPQQPQYQLPMQPYPPYQKSPTPPKKSHKTLFFVLGVIVGVVMLPLLGCIIISTLVAGKSLVTQQASNTMATQTASTEQVVNAAYPPIDGIYCDALEQTAYHIHAHLTIYMSSKQVAIPQGIGIASDQSCFYWLHTHTSDGVIHIEFPNQGTPTLGNFLDIWGQSFNTLGFQNELASSTDWTIYVGGKQVTKDFNQLVLQPHQVITIAYNSPNITPDTSFNWPTGE